MRRPRADRATALVLPQARFEKWFDRAASESEEIGLEIWAAWQRYLVQADSTRSGAD